MRTLYKAGLGAVGAVAAGLVLPPLLLASLWGRCGERLVQERRSPDDGLRAAVYVVNCGATTDYFTQVRVERRGWFGWRVDGTAFSAALAGAATEGPAHEVPLTVSWRGPAELEVSYDARVRVSRAQPRVPGTPDIVVRYRPSAPGA